MLKFTNNAHVCIKVLKIYYTLTSLTKHILIRNQRIQLFTFEIRKSTNNAHTTNTATKIHITLTCPPIKGEKDPKHPQRKRE